MEEEQGRKMEEKKKVARRREEEEALKSKTENGIKSGRREYNGIIVFC